ncbi:MAG: DUF2384 domain-containing protein [Planctomycetota bacterium]|nr:MAG: DUF2384 domain-containing protein [Planctomycetota bacterium]
MARLPHARQPGTPARRRSYEQAGRLLGLRKADPVALAQAVEAGFAYAALERFARCADLSVSLVAEAIRLPQRTLARRKAKGRLQPEESDRLLRTSQIFGRALELFEGDRAAAKTWLGTPQRALGGAVPLRFAATDVGAREVDDLIGRLEHGIPA